MPQDRTPRHRRGGRCAGRRGAPARAARRAVPAARSTSVGPLAAPRRRRPRGAARDGRGGPRSTLIRRAPPDAPVLAQQRDRLELDALVVHRAPGPGQEERPSHCRHASAPAASSRRPARRHSRRRRRGTRAACRRRWRPRAGAPAASRAASVPSATAAAQSSSNHAGGAGAGTSRSAARARLGAEPVTIGSAAPPIVWGATPSTSRPSRSGAASSSACLIASSSVTDDAEQSEQLPRRWIRATPFSSESSSTLPPWDSM